VTVEQNSHKYNLEKERETMIIMTVINLLLIQTQINKNKLHHGNEKH